MPAALDAVSRQTNLFDPVADREPVARPDPSQVMLASSLATELAVLHPGQRAAATHDGNLVILAGPGAGKTRTLVARVGYLLAVTSPHRGVAAITYTDAAAREVTARLRRLGLSPGRRLASRTVHAFCLQHILLPYGDIAGHPVPPGFQVLDAAGSERLWDQALTAAGVYLGRRGARDELPTVTRIRRRRAAGEDVSDFTVQHRRAVAAYERRLRENNLLDFDAMTFDALQVLRVSAPVRDLLVARFPHLVVDEYQDLGPVLHVLVTVLLDAGMTVTAVGDPDQTMFEFQGADPRYLNELANRKGIAPIRLTLNYRSGSALVAAGRAALGADRGYSHDPDRADPGVIEIVPVGGDLDAHAACTVQVVRSMLDRGVRAEDIAVLYPGQTTLQQQIEAALVAAGIPFDSERARRVPDGPLADLVAACTARRLSGPLPGHDTPLPRTHPAGTGRRPSGGGRAPATVRELAATWHRLRAEAGIADGDEVRALARLLLGALDGPDREEAADDATGFLITLSEVLDLPRLAAARNDRRDQYAPSALDGARDSGLTMAELTGGRVPGRLVLTTYHSAKGREFSAVVLPGLVEGLVPFYFANQGITEKELERARRLFYVAVTRAADAVVLIPGTLFTAWGRTFHTMWSRFVSDIQQEINLSA
jgi:DNA helicase-2/ATP-dependent DNA helicase PcrA